MNTSVQNCDVPLLSVRLRVASTAAARRAMLRRHSQTTGYDAANQRSVALYHPRQHLWHEHVAWNEDFTLIVGLTPTGRATVDTLEP